MQLEFSTILMYTAIFSSLIPVFTLFIRRNSVPKLFFWTLFIICFLGFTTDTVSVILILNEKNAFSIFYIYSTLLSVAFFQLYRQQFTSPTIRSSINMASIGFLAIPVYFFFFKDGLNNYNTEPYILFSILAIFLSLYYFYYIFVQMEIPKLTSHYFFWINSAFLIYFGSTFFLTAFEKIIVQPNLNLASVLWPIQHIVTIIYNLILAKGVWTTKAI